MENLVVEVGWADDHHAYRVTSVNGPTVEADMTGPFFTHWVGAANRLGDEGWRLIQVIPWGGGQPMDLVFSRIVADS